MSAETAFLTRSNPWRKMKSVNETSNGYVSKIPRATDPFVAAGVSGDAGTATGASVVRWVEADTNGGLGQNGIECCFYGVGANNTTFSCRILGWSPLVTDRLGVVSPDTNLWIPVVLVEVACTLSSTPIGLAGKAIVATELFVDTMTITSNTANAGVDVDVVSPANDTIARLMLDVQGHMAVEFQFTTGGSATSCNGLYRPL